MLTLQNLAEQLNLSPSTISRALARSPLVSQATARRVLTLAEQLGFQPNILAAGLRRGQSQTIGVIVPHLSNNFFARVVHGIETIASQLGYQVLICQSGDNVQRERWCLEQLLRASLAGVLVSVAHNTRELDSFEAARKGQVPLVFFDRYPDGLVVNAAVIDDRLGGYQATKHLLKQGYRCIAHLTGPSHLSIYRQRRLGYEDALREEGLPLQPGLVLTSDLREAAGAAATSQLLALPRPPDAVFAASDFAALGCLKTLLLRGCRVPDDIGVIGFGNEFFSTVTMPALSTVDQQCEQLGHSATLLLLGLRQEEGVRATRHVVLLPKLLARASSMRQVVK